MKKEPPITYYVEFWGDYPQERFLANTDSSARRYAKQKYGDLLLCVYRDHPDGNDFVIVLENKRGK